MKIHRIVTEDSIAEQWRMLLHFSYEPNVRRFLEKRGHTYTDDLGEFIAGCIRQGEAYFTSAQNAPLDISPLLLYYGLTNLLAGATALIKGAKPHIVSHGMRVKVSQKVQDAVEAESVDETEQPSKEPQDEPDAQEEQLEDGGDIAIANEVLDAQAPTRAPTGLAALRIVPDSPNDGGLSVYADVFSPGTNFRMQHPWTLEELLGSIPDLREEFLNCYPNAACYVIPVELIRRRHATFERINLQHLEGYARRFSGVNRVEFFIQMVDGFKEGYLPPQRAHGYVPLRRKLNGRDIGIYSMFGHKFLALPHMIDRDPNAEVALNKLHTPSPLIVLLMSLYALGYVSRYRPELWNPFVRNDNTGEKMMVERLLYIAARYAPNLVLNTIHDERLRFVPPTQEIGEVFEEQSRIAVGIRDGREIVGNHSPLLWSENELEGWVKEAVRDTLRRLEER